MVRGYEGAFTVDEYTFNELSKLGAGAGSVAGAGKPHFDALMVDIRKLSPGLLTLFVDAASGKHIPILELFGLRAQGDGLQKVSDPKLTDATVAGFANDGAHDTAIAFNFATPARSCRARTRMAWSMPAGPLTSRPVQ